MKRSFVVATLSGALQHRTRFGGTAATPAAYLPQEPRADYQATATCVRFSPHIPDLLAAGYDNGDVRWAPCALARLHAMTVPAPTGYSAVPKRRPSALGSVCAYRR